jgi:hypothetical protein
MSKNIRRGRSWQQRDWRSILDPSEDLTDRARAAFDRLRQVRHMRRPAAAQRAGSHDLARTVAPFLGDGMPVGGPFIIRPEFRGFP